MNATAQLDKTDSQLADMRRSVEAPGFRCRTAEELRALNRREFTDLIDGPPASPAIEPTPSQESEAALAELLADLRRLEAEAKALC